MSKRIRRSDIPEERYVCKEGERILVNEEVVKAIDDMFDELDDMLEQEQEEASDDE
ncbi:unnamed protein product [marine sediment metagenome]|uniref:Uncharacterized protein n=1 Tax=marine sediment metagenome TaxID=412755 RepID=X0ZR34_9ZZZZ